MRQKVLKVSSNYNTYPTRFILYHPMGLDQARVSLNSLLTRPLQDTTFIRPRLRQWSWIILFVAMGWVEPGQVSQQRSNLY